MRLHTEWSEEAPYKCLPFTLRGVHISLFINAMTLGMPPPWNHFPVPAVSITWLWRAKGTPKCDKTLFLVVYSWNEQEGQEQWRNRGWKASQGNQMPELEMQFTFSTSIHSERNAIMCLNIAGKLKIKVVWQIDGWKIQWGLFITKISPLGLSHWTNFVKWVIRGDKTLRTCTLPWAWAIGCCWNNNLQSWECLEVICTLHVADSESNSGQEGDLELSASALSGSSSKLDSTLKSDLKCAHGHSYFEHLPRMGISSVSCPWSRRLDTLIVKISSLNSEILLLQHLSCRALEFGGFAFVYIVLF